MCREMPRTNMVAGTLALGEAGQESPRIIGREPATRDKRQGSVRVVGMPDKSPSPMATLRRHVFRPELHRNGHMAMCGWPWEVSPIEWAFIPASIHPD